MNHALLLADLNRLNPGRQNKVFATPSSKGFVGGLETRLPGDLYRWEGLKRGGDPEHPYVVFQYSLSGWGRYQEDGRSHRLGTGTAFTASIPGNHVYDLPPDSPEWTFLFFVIFHPYVVARMAQVKASVGAVLEIPIDSPLLARAVRLFEDSCLGSFRDEWAAESALFEFLMEYERFCHHLRYAPTERERLLNEVRREVMEDLTRPPDGDRLARARGMSRSHFSHAFKAATGLSPGQFVAQVRLEEVTRRLLTTHQTLDTIAAEVGYADATHLCKVFRRHYHMSPGSFRW